MPLGGGAGPARQHGCWHSCSGQPFDRCGLALLLLEGLIALAERLLGQPALGLGDAKLAALGGAWLGPGGIAAAMALAVVSGALVGSTARLSGRLGPREPFPFGPFIALGIWLIWLIGPQWWWSTWVMLLGA